ncbi:MAG TPA: hypothetical protein VJS91_02830 [Nitrososphaeraceae archaeon]|nr:hypothetical protein [Nitrososphaeraceae archaeon]
MNSIRSGQRQRQTCYFGNRITERSRLINADSGGNFIDVSIQTVKIENRQQKS